MVSRAGSNRCPHCRQPASFWPANAAESLWRRQVASTWRNGVAAVVACGPREVRLADPSGSQEHVFLVVFDELV